MKVQNRQFGVTLVEMTVTVAVVSLLAVLATPSIRAYFNSLGSPAEVKSAVSAAFASARAIAAKEQHYAGVRFQQDLSGKQYMIFIIQDPNLRDSTGYQVAYGFRAVEGFNPIKLPENIGVMDFQLGVTGQVISTDSLIDQDFEFNDTTTFSIIFSPAGKLVIHDVQVLRKDGYDKVFNNTSIFSDVMFEDDYNVSSLSYRKEPSRNSFVIYDKTEFNKVDSARRWSDYLYQLASEVIYINPYTGTIIQK